jgi:hypothetical protein
MAHEVQGPFLRSEWKKMIYLTSMRALFYIFSLLVRRLAMNRMFNTSIVLLLLAALQAQTKEEIGYLGTVTDILDG